MRKWHDSDANKEARERDLAKRRDQGREGLIQKCFRDISYGLGFIITKMPMAESKADVRQQLQRLANQLASAGIYPDTK